MSELKAEVADVFPCRDIMNNKVFYQHPNLMRALGMHETVMEVMVNVLGGGESKVRTSFVLAAEKMFCVVLLATVIIFIFIHFKWDRNTVEEWQVWQIVLSWSFGNAKWQFVYDNVMFFFFLLQLFREDVTVDCVVHSLVFFLLSLMLLQSTLC